MNMTEHILWILLAVGICICSARWLKEAEKAKRWVTAMMWALAFLIYMIMGAIHIDALVHPFR